MTERLRGCITSRKIEKLLTVIRNLRPDGVFSGTMLDRNMPDPRHPNPSRDRFNLAMLSVRINSKEAALAQIKDSLVTLAVCYEYEVEFNSKVYQEALELAEKYGATDAEISQALSDGQIAAATFRAGFYRF